MDLNTPIGWVIGGGVLFLNLRIVWAWLSERKNGKKMDTKDTNFVTVSDCAAHNDEFKQMFENCEKKFVKIEERVTEIRLDIKGIKTKMQERRREFGSGDG
jgi:Skp family chaperone for outer membrane proteins